MSLGACPRCAVGLLYAVAEYEQGSIVRCLTCDYQESRLAPGYIVDAPGEEARKVEAAPGAGGEG